VTEARTSASDPKSEYKTRTGCIHRFKIRKNLQNTHFTGEENNLAATNLPAELKIIIKNSGYSVEISF
jgi:hypothetical protein